MTTQELERQLNQLSPDDKARVFQRLTLDLTHACPGIEAAPGL